MVYLNPQPSSDIPQTDPRPRIIVLFKPIGIYLIISTDFIILAIMAIITIKKHHVDLLSRHFILHLLENFFPMIFQILFLPRIYNVNSILFIQRDTHRVKVYSLCSV